MAEGTYAVSYGYVPDMATRREAHRAAHLEFIQGLTERGEVLLAGALTDPIDGAWLLVRADSPGAARALLDPDPYAAAGLIRSLTIRPIALVVP